MHLITRNSISYKLFLSGIIVLFFIILIAIAGDICIRTLKKTSNLIVVEYKELESIQNMRYALSKVHTPLVNYFMENDPDHFQNFQKRMAEARQSLGTCKLVITHRHNKFLLARVEEDLLSVENIGNSVFIKKSSMDTADRQAVQGQIQYIIDKSMHDILSLQTETNHEITRYVQTNRTAIIHSTITIVSLGAILGLIVVIGGYFFIKNLTSPLYGILDTIRQVIKGDMRAKVKIISRDEFGELATAFNLMLNHIENVTVSRDLYNDILNSMFNGLIVTDYQGLIISVNHAGSGILEGSSESLKGKFLQTIIADIHEGEKLGEVAQRGIPYMQTETVMISHRGKNVPVLIAGTPLPAKDGGIGKYVVVFHDLSERKKIERTIENIRKEQAIAINEAQEKERLRIATDLHDGLGQILTAISYSYQNLVSGYQDDVNNDHKEDWLKIKTLINTAIGESKRIAHNLIPLALEDFGLIPAIHQLIDQVNLQSETKFSFDSFNMEQQRIDPRLEKALYRICQEAINNILKHARAESAYIQLIRHERSVVMVIEDNGVGFDAKNVETEYKSIGLVSIRERATTFSGSLIINSSERTGTELIVELPCMQS